MNAGISFLAKKAFFSDVTITSSIGGTFHNFSVTRVVRMIHAKNYEKLSKFVKITAKILSVGLISPFFPHTECPFTTIMTHFAPLFTKSIDHRHNCSYFPTSSISCTYFTLGNCQDVNITKQEVKVIDKKRLTGGPFSG